MWRSLLMRLPGWSIIAVGLTVFVAALALGASGSGPMQPAIVLIGPITLVACIVWLGVREGLRGAAALERDPELGFAWSVQAEGARIIWRRKVSLQRPAFARMIVLEAWAYAFFTLLLGVGYGVVVWNVSRTGGLRPGDLPTAIPVAVVAVGLYAVIVRFAVNAFRNQVVTEIVADRQHQLLHCTGVRPLRGRVSTVSIPMASISRVSQRASTYRSVTTVTVTLRLTDGRSHLLARFSPADWERVGGDLLVMVGAVESAH